MWNVEIGSKQKKSDIFLVYHKCNFGTLLVFITLGVFYLLII